MDTLLLQRFWFTKPIEIVSLPEGSGNEIVALPEKIIIKGDSASFKKDFAELLSHAKLGEDDPLLTTFFFQKNITQQEEKYASMFFSLCQPLQDAWVYKIMRKYAPDVYAREVAELFEMWQKLYQGVLQDNNNIERRQILGMWAIIYENPANDSKLIVQTDEKNRADWDAYMEALKEYIRKEPNVEYYIKLPEIVNAPYKVSIENDNGFRHYRITGLPF